MEHHSAFPVPIFVFAAPGADPGYLRDVARVIRDSNQTGLSVRDYFAAHAPVLCPRWFAPKMETDRPKPEHSPIDGLVENSADLDSWNEESMKEASRQWPYAWADMMLAEREK